MVITGSQPCIRRAVACDETRWFCNGSREYVKVTFARLCPQASDGLFARLKMRGGREEISERKANNEKRSVWRVEL